MSLKLIGDKDLKRKLDQLGVKARVALLPAARAGAKPIQRVANQKAPGPNIVTGNEEVEGGRAEISIGPDKEHWYYGFFEFGATEHEIKGKPLLAFEGDSGPVITKRIKSHPGMPAEPFLRPAADSQKNAAKDEAGKVFRVEINKLTVSG